MKTLLSLLVVTMLPWAVSARPPTDTDLETENMIFQVKDILDHPSVVMLKNKRAGFNWTKIPTSIPLLERVHINGRPVPVQWKFSKGGNRSNTQSKDVRNPSPKAGHYDETPSIRSLYLVSENPKLELRSIWEVRSESGPTGHTPENDREPKPGPIRHHLEIINKSGEDIEVELLPSLDLTLSLPEGHQLENWWVEKGAGTPSGEGTHREKIGPGYEFFQKSSGYAEQREMIPWISVQDTTAGHGFYVGIEFSGLVGIKLKASDDAKTLHLTAGIDPSATGFRSRVKNGESFETPVVFISCYNGDVDDGSNQLRHYVSKHLRAPVSDVRYPLVTNNSWGSGMAVDEKLARKMIEDSSALGVEMFHIDAGWFRTVGDWRTSPEKFPNGLDPVSEFARSKGMRFGLWTAWTQGGIAPRGMDNLAVNNPDQKNWFTKDYATDWRPEPFIGAPVCLGCKAARDWSVKEVRRMVKDYKLELLEHDQMMVVNECDRLDHDHTADPADVAYHAAKGYYAVYDQIRKENPDLIFENCVNGGRMVDYGVIQRTHYISITDTYDPLSNRRAFHDSSYAIPPSMCEAYIENHPGPTLGTFKFMIRSGMMGWFTLMCDTGSWSAEQRAAAKRQIEIYKTWIRPLINHANLYHISERPDPKRWDAMQYFDPKTGKGIVFAFRGNESGESNHHFVLKGLTAEDTYKLWLEDQPEIKHQLTGKELMQTGVPLELTEAGSSELIYLQKE